MASIDDSDNPIKGFQLVHHPDGLYLHCRGRECRYRRHLSRIAYLEQILNLAATHRAECGRPTQTISVSCIVEARLV